MIYFNWTKWWTNRKIDWNIHYLQTFNHPHRHLIVQVLKTFGWTSLWEVGCASGPNLVLIAKEMVGKQLGGNDVNAEAIELAKQTLKGGVFEVSPADDIIMSDEACDVILTDMTLIYTNPWKIKKTLRELKRICRNRIILVEFDSIKWYRRLWLKLTQGYGAYDYKRLLEKIGCYDIIKYPIPPQYYDNAKTHKEFATLISARV